MTYESDDLEELLRQNLKLRRQLGAQVVKAKDSMGLYSPQTSKPARLLAKLSRTSVQDVVPPSNEPSGGLAPEPTSEISPALGREFPSSIEMPKAQDGDRSQSGEGALSSDLDELRGQLRLRRELGARIAKSMEVSPKKSNKIAFRSGQALYWTSLAMAGTSAFLLLRLTGEWHFDYRTLVAASLSAFIFYGLGRDFLYTLSGR